jgi:hypothetical protein
VGRVVERAIHPADKDLWHTFGSITSRVCRFSC